MPMLRMSSGIRACVPTSEEGGSVSEMFSVPGKTRLPDIKSGNPIRPIGFSGAVANSSSAPRRSE
jgi:hypothetical protein